MSAEKCRKIKAVVILVMLAMAEARQVQQNSQQLTVTFDEVRMELNATIPIVVLHKTSPSLELKTRVPRFIVEQNETRTVNVEDGIELMRPSLQDDAKRISKEKDAMRVELHSPTAALKHAFPLVKHWRSRQIGAVSKHESVDSWDGKNVKSYLISFAATTRSIGRSVVRVRSWRTCAHAVARRLRGTRRNSMTYVNDEESGNLWDEHDVQASLEAHSRNAYLNNLETNDLDNEGDIPDSSQEAIFDAIPPALERERRFTTEWWRLASRVTWLSRPAEQVVAPSVNPHGAWSGTKDKPWPSSISITGRASRMFEECMAFRDFMWEQTQPWMCLMMAMLLGVIPSGATRLTGYLMDEVNVGKHVNAHTKEDRVRDTAIYAIALLVLFLFQKRLQYKFEIDIPGASARMRLRQMVMHKLRRLPPDSSVLQRVSPSVLNDQVYLTVYNIWSTYFTFVIAISGMLGNVTVTLHVLSEHWANGAPSWIMTFLAVFSKLIGLFVIVPAVCAFYRDRNQVLSRLQVHWHQRLVALSASQLAQLKAQDVPRLNDEAQFRAFGNAAFLFRRRAFHNYFMGLVTTDAVDLIMYTLYITTVIGCGLHVIYGHFTIGDFAVVTGSMLQSRSLCSTLTGMYVGLSTGHAALVQVAAVLNAEERTVWPIPAHLSGESRRRDSLATDVGNISPARQEFDRYRCGWSYETRRHFVRGASGLRRWTSPSWTSFNGSRS